MGKKMKILVLPGDGVGPEVTSEALKVISIISEIYNLDINIEEGFFGGIAVDKLGSPFPDETKNKINNSDAILLGAVGGEKYDNLSKDKKPETGLLELRKQLNLFINIRPIISFSELSNSSSIKSEFIDNLDIVIIRELVGGLYFGEPRGFSDDNTEAFNTMRYNNSEINRISEYAFKLSRKRGKKLCSVDKANVLEVSQLWRLAVNKLSKHYQDVHLSHMYVDNAAMQLVRDPAQFDVMLCSNLFGDILSDICAMITGSMGLLPSASLNEQGFGMYEPAGGTAPDIAGKGIANPIAQILSAALMLRHSLNQEAAASAIEQAVADALNDGNFTGDLLSAELRHQAKSTEEMGDIICQHLIDNHKNSGAN